MSLDGLNDFSCPRCSERVGDFDGLDLNRHENDQFRIVTNCQNCDTPVDIVINMNRSDTPSVDIWLEPRDIQSDELDIK